MNEWLTELHIEQIKLKCGNCDTELTMEDICWKTAAIGPSTGDKWCKKCLTTPINELVKQSQENK